MNPDIPAHQPEQQQFTPLQPGQSFNFDDANAMAKISSQFQITDEQYFTIHRYLQVIGLSLKGKGADNKLNNLIKLISFLQYNRDMQQLAAAPTPEETQQQTLINAQMLLGNKL